MSDHHLSEEEQKYRKILRDLIVEETERFLREHQAEIVQKATERAKLLLKLGAR